MQAVGRKGYRVHDLLLDFARCRIQQASLEKAVMCQAQYLSRLDVVYSYVDEIFNVDGFYPLLALWRSVEMLSDNPQLQVEAYRASLRESEEDIMTEASDRFVVARLLFMQVGARYVTCRVPPRMRAS